MMATTQWSWSGGNSWHFRLYYSLIIPMLVMSMFPSGFVHFFLACHILLFSAHFIAFFVMLVWGICFIVVRLRYINSCKVKKSIGWLMGNRLCCPLFCYPYSCWNKTFEFTQIICFSLYAWLFVTIFSYNSLLFVIGGGNIELLWSFMES